MNEDEPRPRATKSGTLFIPVTGLTVLCLVAIIAQAAGLFSVVTYVTSREGWEAQKEQYSAVTSEWEAMSMSTRSKIDEQKKLEIEAEQSRVNKEKDLELTQEKLATAKGELLTIQDAAESALELQRRSQSQEQTLLDNIQDLRKDVASFEKQKSDLQVAIKASEEQLEGYKSRITENQSTLDSQDRQLQGNQQDLLLLDGSLMKTREELRKLSDELVQANDDLTKALALKKSAVSEAQAATVLVAQIEALKTQKTQFEGELDALAMQKSDLNKSLATADSRMAVAQSKLADYLNKWNNREQIDQEFNQLLQKVQNLKQAESDTMTNITTLSDQSIKLETKVKSLQKETQQAEQTLADLKTQQKNLLAELIELQKLKEKVEEEPQDEAPATVPSEGSDE